MTHTLRICSSQEMRRLDEIAEKEYGIDATLLMENAGRAAVQVMLENYPAAGEETEILVLAGKGNNAGDAFVMARRLLSLGRRVKVFHLSEEKAYADAALKNFKILSAMKAKLIHLESVVELEEYLGSASGPFTIVDGLIGTGLRGNIEGVYRDVIDLVNSIRCDQVVALDIPSGVSGDTGAVRGTSVQASLTVSFGFPKMGHFLPPGAGRRGKLVNIDLPFPPKFRKEGDQFLLLPDPMRALLSERDRYGHKNSFGHTLLVGGSPGRVGAIAMAAAAAHKMGTGLVTVATWADAFQTLLIKLPNETMSVPLVLEGPELDTYKKNLSTYSSIVIGPGLGLRADGKKVLEELFSTYTGPMVIDADALNMISDHGFHDRLVQRRAPTILTPHMGEMARLLKRPKEEVMADPVKAIREAVQKTHAIVVLKGAATLIASADERIFLSHYPNDGMATAGSGDVLAGMIGGLVGQGMDPFESAQMGVYLHSLAGDFAARAQGHRSMTAPDIINNIAHAFQEIKNPATRTAPVAGRNTLL